MARDWFNQEAKQLTDRGNQVKAKAEQESYSNETQILSKETDTIWETRAKIKTWSVAKDIR